MQSFGQGQMQRKCLAHQNLPDVLVHPFQYVLLVYLKVNAIDDDILNITLSLQRDMATSFLFILSIQADSDRMGFGSFHTLKDFFVVA